MSGPFTVEGFAIVSGDGMLANAAGVMPDELKFPADHHYFQSGLDRAAAVIQGRYSHEGGPHADGRRRLIATRQIASFARDPVNANAMLWNPAGASLEEALVELGVTDGMLGIIGGTDVFGLFLESGYDAFHLSRAPRHITRPGGRPVFPQVLLGKTPEEILAEHGLKAGEIKSLDQDAGVTVQVFTR
jgi:dihydrofolate reductase